MSPIDPRPWPGLTVGRRIADGARSEVWTGALDGEPVAVRRSRRSPESLAWELDLLVDLDSRGFVVPVPIPSADGRRAVDGVTVQRWIDGRPPASERDWRAVAATLQRLHAATREHPQRPGCVLVWELRDARRSVDADLDVLPDEVEHELVAVFDDVRAETTSVVHGDPGPGNLRLRGDGSVGLIDWDESRVDVSMHDLSNLGVVVLPPADHRRARRLSDAWESAHGWVVEPDYARGRLESLRQND